MIHAYSNLHSIKTIGLRFFTVYGTWGRPDMAYFIFTKSIIENKEIDLFNNGIHSRSFTYITDIIETVNRLISSIETNHSLLNNNEVLNVGGAEPVKLFHFTSLIEKYLGKKAIVNLKLMQKGDVKETNENISKLEKMTGYKPQINIEEGIKKFIDWYKTYYQIQ